MAFPPYTIIDWRVWSQCIGYLLPFGVVCETYYDVDNDEWRLVAKSKDKLVRLVLKRENYHDDPKLWRDRIFLLL